MHPAALPNPQPTGNFFCIKMDTLESEIDHEKIDADQLIVREAQSIPTPPPHDQPTLNQDFLESSDLTANYEEGAPTPPDPSLNPGEKGLKLPDIPFLQKAQVPNLPVTLSKEVPDPDPGQIAKSKTCDVPKLR